jgi:exoribonuclease R
MVEVVDLEPAPVRQAVVGHELPGEIDGDGGNIDPVIVESPAGQPQCTTPPATCQLEGISRLGEEVLVFYEYRGRAKLIHRGHPPVAIAAVPVTAVCFAHRRDDTGSHTSPGHPYHPTVPLRQLRFTAPDAVVEAGLETIREERQIPERFSPEVMAEVHAMAPSFPERDMTDIPFVTIDPPGSRDLDQALHLSRKPGGYTVRYAIADVGAFVRPGSAIEAEAWERGQTLYAPDVRTPLYPEELSEGRASLLPDRDRPAILWEVELDERGELEAGRVERAMVRSRIQLTYEEVQRQIDSGTASGSLRLLPEIGRLRRLLERERGAVSLNIPEQLVVKRDGGWGLVFQAPLPVESWNAQLSLLTGIFAAGMMVEAGVGILRTLPVADPRRLDRLRLIADGLEIAWPGSVSYPELIRSLDPRIPAHAAFQAEATTLFAGAGYQAISEAEKPLPHAALATIYAHATAPLRRLVDRYAGEACLAIAAGEKVPDFVVEALPQLPEIMARSATRAGQYEAECVNLIEAALMSTRVGEIFPGVVVEIDEERSRGEVQLGDPAILSIVEGEGLDLGDQVLVRVNEASVADRRVRFEIV